jgi:hypothetical protein
MRLLNVRGKPTNLNVARFAIKWDGDSLSSPQFKVKQFLKPYWQFDMCYEEFPVFGSRLKVDILNATKKVGVEIHGPQHEEFHYFHNKSRFNYLKGIKNDVIKTEWLEKNGFTLVVIYTKEVDLISPAFFLDKFGISL